MNRGLGRIFKSGETAMPQKGKLIVVTGPSGVGKRTLISHVLERVPDCWFSVSATTRAPRPGEVDGKDYFFITPGEFQRRIDVEGFFEWARFADNFYGTPRAEIEEKLGQGVNVLAELEVQGALVTKRKMPEAQTIFISPPDPPFETLRERILVRGDVSAESMALRLQTAQWELAQDYLFDYQVVNDQLEVAKDEMLCTVRQLIKGRAVA
jgi:guanylate kinase